MGDRKEISNDEDFKVSGPLHLATTIDWNKPEHECSVIACLVKATYVLESDRKETSREPLAPEWSTSFGFKQIKIFTDKMDNSIFAAIYRNTRFNNQTSQGPKFVIAFRGTILGVDNKQDLQLDLRIAVGGLSSSSRWNEVMPDIEHHISKYGAEGTVLAGHSLGASMALLARAHMVPKGIYLKTFLFNLPSCLTDEKDSKMLIASRFLVCMPWVLMLPLTIFLCVGTVTSLVTTNILIAIYKFFLMILLTGLAMANVLSMETESTENEMSTPFVPYLFVNPGDVICKQWITYFRKKSKENKRSKLQSASYVESGVLEINLTPGKGMLNGAHDLKQWWKKSLNLLSLEEYRSRRVIHIF